MLPWQRHTVHTNAVWAEMRAHKRRNPTYSLIGRLDESSEMLRVAVRVRRGPRALGLSRSAFCREFGCAKVPNPLIKSGVQEAVVTIVGFRPGCRNKKMHD
jgi:hypothetical protein